MKIYKAHILFTKERNRFEVLDNSYVAVDANGRVAGVATDLTSLGTDTSDRRPLDIDEAEIVDFGDRLLIPAMNDLHVHAAQYRNQGLAMDLELLPWLHNYSFPEEMKYLCDWLKRRIAYLDTHTFAAREGDVDGDGNVNVTDVTQLINYIMGNHELSKTYGADVNGDGYINVVDVTSLISIILKM